MKKTKKRAFRLWSLAEVQNTLPLVDSILATIRERFINGRYLKRAMAKITNAHGRPTREQLVRLQNLQTQWNESDRVEEAAAKELLDLGAVCYDPVCSIAFFPFSKRDADGYSPAWFVYSPNGHTLAWRYDHDPMTQQRDLKELV